MSSGLCRYRESGVLQADKRKKEKGRPGRPPEEEEEKAKEKEGGRGRPKKSRTGEQNSLYTVQKPTQNAQRPSQVPELVSQNLPENAP